MTAPKFKIKKGDQVIVITGKDKGRQGQVLEVIPREARVVVQGINIVKRHKKPTQADVGGIVEKNKSIHISNVSHIDPTSKKPTRVGYRIEDGEKRRFAKASGQLI
jgi:large subunit ribosomal protein L24